MENRVPTDFNIYRIECIPLIDAGIERLKRLQGNLLKQTLGLTKRRHNSNLLNTLNINTTETVIKRNTAFFVKHISNVPSPVQQFCCHFMSLALELFSPGTVGCSIV